ncbi:hypothetical protein [Niabella sp.]|uniref:hypothetical protein n=1 Tax=Niabella sp. TaxID=1962976 RepID=UPI00260D960C|nr:hypothetical protein [Niabella sp.]
MKRYLLLLLTLSFFASSGILAQTNPGSVKSPPAKECYAEKNEPDYMDPLKTAIERAAYYKGTPEQSLPAFAGIRVEEVFTGTTRPNYYKDSVIAAFVINQDATMSNLTLSGNNASFKKVVQKHVQQSACGWRTAEHNGKAVACLVRMKFLLKIDNLTEANKSTSSISWSYIEK